MYLNNLILGVFFLLMLVCCKREEMANPASENPLLLQHTWMIKRASSAGSGYNFSFSRGVTTDPFQLSIVRVKFLTGGKIWGIDNVGNEVSKGIWKYYKDDNIIEVSGTGIFGIDGSLNVVSLSMDSLKVKNMLKISQLDAVVDLQATLVPE